MHTISKVKKGNPETVNKRMGLWYLGKRFQMNSKKTPVDFHGIVDEDGTVHYRLIEAWIEHEPLKLWRDLYTKGGYSRLQLCCNSLKLLHNRMRELYPAFYEERLRRKVKSS